jgi:tetratricopeptide (TPR) repeat protein
MISILICFSIVYPQNVSDPGKSQAEIKQLNEKIKTLEEIIQKNENERVQMQHELDFMSNKLKNLENAPRLNGDSINLFAVVVAVFTLAIIVATAYFVVNTYQFRQDAKEELQKIEGIRKDIKNAEEQLTNSAKTALEKVETERCIVIEKVKIDLDTELKKAVETTFEECKNKIQISINNELSAFKENLYNYTDLPIDGIAKGNEELANNNFKLAEVYYMQELFKNPNQANAWVGLARSYSGMENYKEALNAIRTAVKLDRNKPLFNKDGQISIIQAEVLMKLNRYKEAHEVLENEVLVINPNFKKAQKLLSECNKSIPQD